MRKLLCLGMLVTASFLIACEPAANTNSANKPANAVNNSAQAPAANSAAVETELKKLVSETAAALAKNDVATLEKLYSDNYMLVNLDGSVQNKTERLGSMRSGDTKFDSFSYDEVSVRSNPEGTGAVVIARAPAAGINKGKKTEGTIRVTQVWAKTATGWRQVSGHATQISASSASPATADTNKAAATNNNANGSR